MTTNREILQTRDLLLAVSELAAMQVLRLSAAKSDEMTLQQAYERYGVGWIRGAFADGKSAISAARNSKKFAQIPVAG